MTFADKPANTVQPGDKVRNGTSFWTVAEVGPAGRGFRKGTVRCTFTDGRRWEVSPNFPVAVVD